MAEIGAPIREIEVTPAELPVPTFAPGPDELPVHEEIEVEAST